MISVEIHTLGIVLNLSNSSIYSSLVIEILQLLLMVGQVQLSDLVHNTVGGMIGCGVWWIVNALHPEDFQ